MISLVILAKEKTERLEELLKKIASEFDEVIIINNIDDFFLKTLERKYPNLKIIFLKSYDFSLLRNKALEEAKNEWVLYIDEDEIISKILIKEIKRKILNTNKQAFLLPRREFFLGREVKYGEVLKQRKIGIIRLVKKGVGKWKGVVHEVFVTKGKVGKLKNAILHYSHKSSGEFLKKVNFYSTLRAKELFKEKQNFCFCQILIYPFFKFLYTYFFLLGFLDGYRGFVYSFMMAFHSFLVRAKLYQYRNFK